MLRALAIPLLVTIALRAQSIGNNGDPMRVPFSCTEQDVEFAGMFCTEMQPCPIYLELTAVAGNSQKILIAGNLHSDTATLYSILLMSDDAGATWKEPAPRVRGASLDQLQLLDAQHAWAAGEVQYPLPQDPFFLVSTDGGFSWRQRAVSDEGGPGAIQTFWFDSAQHGELVIDAGKTASSGRYISYESQTGGDTWMVRAMVDQAPKIRTAPADSEWRIEAGKDGKGWEIEKRDGARWAKVAAFLVQPGSCGSTQ